MIGARIPYTLFEGHEDYNVPTSMASTIGRQGFRVWGSKGLGFRAPGF